MNDMKDLAMPDGPGSRASTEPADAVSAVPASIPIARLVAALQDALGINGSSHARHNLDGAIIDSENGNCDRISLGTMRRVRDQIADVEDILERAAQGIEALGRDAQRLDAEHKSPVGNADAPE